MRTTRTATACEPTAAERVRSVLAVAPSVGVTANGTREDIMTGAAAEFGEAFRLRVPGDSLTAAEAACAPGAGQPGMRHEQRGPPSTSSSQVPGTTSQWRSSAYRTAVRGSWSGAARC